jgi:small-conductance mechanosensitive channel
LSSSALEQYRQAKNDYLKLRNQAKKELMSRFQDLAAELFQVQRELLEDFGEKVAIPSKPKKARPSAKKKSAAPQPAPAAASSPQLDALRKKLEVQHKRLNEAKAGNKPTKVIEDRIYEIEDAIRLANTK